MQNIGQIIRFGALAAMISISSASFAVTKTSNVTSGNFETANSWSPSGVPQNGDSIIIKAGHTIRVTNGNTYTGNPMYLKVSGSGVLKFNNGNNPRLTLPSGSLVVLETGGEVQPGNSGKDRLFVGPGLVYSDNMNTLSGPAQSNGLGPLPVVWGKFVAQVIEKSVVNLSWEVMMEESNARFDVERSLDGQHFQTVQVIASRGNSSTRQAYSYTDQTLSVRVAYYRIRQVDIDGSFSYSALARVEVVPPAIEVNVYPNPVTSELRVHINTASAIIRIADGSGRVMEEKTIGANEVFDVSTYPAGLYFYTIVSPCGSMVSGSILK